MKRLMPIVLTLAALVPAAAIGQQPPSPRPPAPEDGFAKFLFPPELVMQQQAAIALKAEQRAAITRGVRDFQGKVLELQWQMQDETQRLGELLDRPSVDQSAALAQVEKVLAVERAVKLAHLALLIQIKNLLTPEQQAWLAEARGGPE